MSVTRALFAPALLSLVLLAAPGPAVAAPPAPQSIAVTIGDLDLATDKGQRILALRIQRAARAMCKAEALDRLPHTMRSARACIRESRARAEAAAEILNAAREAPAQLGG
ncbi:MAG: hypothetical protein OHK0018_11570 [Erythrobacter tepidarius]